MSHRLDDDLPGSLAQRVPRTGVLVDAVDDGAEDVELLLAVGGVTDADRLAPAIAGQVIELGLGQRRVPSTP